MAALRVQAVVGQERHLHQLPGPAVGQAVAVVEQGGAHAHDHRQVVGGRLGPEQAGVDRRVGGVALPRGDARPSGRSISSVSAAEGVLQLRAVARRRP